MKQKRCVICYKPCGGNGNQELNVQQKSQNVEKEEEDCIRNQLAVVFLLRKFINIPQQTCFKFLQEYGNPSLWIYWCDSCSSLVDDAQEVFRRMELLQEQAETLKVALKKAVIASEQRKYVKHLLEEKKANKKLKFPSTPTEEVRSYILLQKDQVLAPSDYCTKRVEKDETESDVSMDDFNISHSSKEINSSDEDEPYIPNSTSRAKKRTHSNASRQSGKISCRETRNIKSQGPSEVRPTRSTILQEASTSHKSKRSKVFNSNTLQAVGSSHTVSIEPSSESDDPPDPPFEDSNSSEEAALTSDQKSLHPAIVELQKEFHGFKESLKHQMELNSEIKETKKLLSQILATQAKPANIMSSPQPQFPLSKTEELFEMEEWLQIPENYSAQVVALSKIGGHKISKNVYNILDHIFCHTFAICIRYTSTSGKIAFKGLKLADAIRDAVRKTSNDAQPTDEEINQYMGRWFRNSTDRKGGRKLRLKSVKSKNSSKNTNREEIVKEEEYDTFEYTSI